MSPAASSIISFTHPPTLVQHFTAHRIFMFTSYFNFACAFLFPFTWAFRTPEYRCSPARRRAEAVSPSLRRANQWPSKTALVCLASGSRANFWSGYADPKMVSLSLAWRGRHPCRPDPPALVRPRRSLHPCSLVLAFGEAAPFAAGFGNTEADASVLPKGRDSCG